MHRNDRLQSIQHLDPATDHWEICHWIAGYEFPWDMTRALEFALFRTFCVPKIAQLLDRTGEFQHRSQKRYDDTGIIVSNILKWGYNSEKGQAMIQRMNRIHGHFPIRNEDYLYVLSTFIYEPVRWINRFGWRKLSEIEQESLYQFWRHVGDQMSIQSIPDSYAAFETYNQQYEEQQFRYSEATQRVGTSTLKMFLEWFPGILRPAVEPMVYALMDERMINAFGFKASSPQVTTLVESLLRFRGLLQCYLPPRQAPDFYADVVQHSYPQGHTLENLGPPGMLKELNQR
jgi:hypothetical protein